MIKPYTEITTRFLAILLALSATLLIATFTFATTSTIPYQVIESAPHNPQSFTQGWVKQGDTFYESSGLYGRSFISREDPYSSTRAQLPRRYFAEGLTLLNNLLFVLTWKEHTLLIIDQDTLKITKRLHYQGEGWGLTHNEKSLIMSNGTSQLLFRDPKDFSIIRTLNVDSLNAINELEYVKGVIWANVWNDDRLYAIDASNGCVMGKVDLSSLRQQAVTPDASNVLNGIAYDQDKNGLWVTGKYWPTRYLIRVPLTLGSHYSTANCIKFDDKTAPQ